MGSGIQIEKDIREQPALLAARLPDYRGFFKSLPDNLSFELVAFVARGSQYNAAVYGKYLLEAGLGVPAIIMSPSVITKHMTDLKYPQSLVIGLATGTGNDDFAEVLNVMSSLGHHTIAVANEADWKIESSTKYVLDLQIGEENEATLTKTYTSSLLSMYLLAEALGALRHLGAGGDLELPDEAWMDSCQKDAQAQLVSILQANPIFAIGRGFGYSAANEFAMKMIEWAHLPCKAYSAAEFQQGPVNIADSLAATVIFGEKPDYFSKLFTKVVSVPQPEKGPIDEIWYAIYAQWMALLAARARGFSL